MKTTLLACLCMALFSFSNLVAQPCDLTNVQLEKMYTGADGRCYADVFFDLAPNNGNKYIYLHFWSLNNYNKIEKADFSNGARGPEYANINGTPANAHPAVATLAIDNSSPANPIWNASNYRPDASVISVKAGSLQATALPSTGGGGKVYYRYTLNGIPLGSLGTACSGASLGFAVWSTQANSANGKIHCSQMGEAVTRDRLFSGAVLCAQSKYTVSVTNKSGKTVSGKIDVFTDKGARNSEGNFDVAKGRKFDAITYFIVEPDQTLSINRTLPDSSLGYNVFAQVVYSDEMTQVAELAATACATLPVVLQSFSATRAKQQVIINWQTASEQAVRGFNIQRKKEGSDWKVIHFERSKATDGHSAEELSYQYVDAVASLYESQYRIQEVGVDGKSTLSEVRNVKGENAGAKVTLFPNPTTNGKASLIFEKASVREVTISDMTGRVVRQYKGLASTSAVIDQLTNGFYNIHVTDRTTGESSVLRLVVKN